MMLTRRIICLLLTILIVIQFTGCATIANGSKQSINVSSTPEGATVKVGGSEHKTPAVIKLNRNGSYVLVISKAGYKTEHIRIKKKINTWGMIDVAATVFFLIPVISLAIDFASGAVYDLYPEYVNINLTPEMQEFGFMLPSPDGGSYQLAVYKMPE